MNIPNANVVDYVGLGVVIIVTVFVAFGVLIGTAAFVKREPTKGEFAEDPLALPKAFAALFWFLLSAGVLGYLFVNFGFWR